MFSQRIDLIGDDAQIFGDNRKIVSQGILDGVKEFIARSLHPLPIDGSLLPEFHRPVGLKPAEMINPEDIKDIQLVPDSGDPPGKAFFLMGIPGIQRIAPQLSRGREVIRRNPGHLEGIAV